MSPLIRREQLCFVILVSAVIPCVQSHAQQQVKLRVHNDIQSSSARRIDFELRSEHSGGGFRERIESGKSTTVNLVSRDRFIAKIQFGGLTFTSKPMALKRALANNPKGVLRLSSLFAAPADQRPQEMVGIQLEDDEGLILGTEHDNVAQQLEPSRRPLLKGILKRR